MKKTLQVSVVLACLMTCASIAGTLARPPERVADGAAAPQYVLDTVVPNRFGDWQALPSGTTRIVNPQTQQMLDKLYSQVLTRTYMNRDGYRIMLSIAYGNDQRGSLQAHKPEVCYPAQGYKLEDLHDTTVQTRFGDIAARQLRTSFGPLQEPVTYWFTMGDTAVRSRLEQRLVEVKYGLTGQIPDGLLFRVSSHDPQAEQAYARQREFVTALLDVLPAQDRTRLSGLAAPRVH